MLLTIDVGNTNITLGVFDHDKLAGTFRMTTKLPRTSDEYGLTICGILEHRDVVPKDIDAVIIASVVPDIMHSLGNGIIKYLKVKPLIVSAGIKTGIRIVTENPKEIGPDRIVDAVAGYEICGGPVIVVDFGTATTYDLIGPNGTFEAGITAPGIETAGRSLWGGAAMLPAIEIKKPQSILAKETISSMQAGLVYGAIGQTEYIIEKIKEESGYQNAVVVATGGLGKIIAQETDSIDEYRPDLTLEGLRLIYNKNRK
ncbi:type III pantothenate kinase [Clostridium sp. AF19-22AC]|jgi:type III pantothenate kinase|uniref:Type III pantothenate kinase n=1 Tax=Faecalicatena orotica TaxID=1544 RepID=A0A2Y9CAE4_9FIRM|nr:MULTISPECIES: type III pantothenate kinase [Clostridia]PWJ27627.1 pantothenate kinase [Faecalicatena orotica]RHR21006.1 type III pantothenate kinase [Clostridium sp. AF19-22AC]SSA57157.1 pantothenate kinase [Faecalicatena orotica]